MPAARDAGAPPTVTARQSRPRRRAKQAAARRAAAKQRPRAIVTPAPVDVRTTPHRISAQASAPSSGSSSAGRLSRGRLSTHRRSKVLAKSVDELTARLEAVERETVEAKKRNSETTTRILRQNADCKRRLADCAKRHSTTTAMLSLVESNVKNLNAYVEAHDPLFEVEQMAVRECDVAYHTLALQLGGHSGSMSPMVNWAARWLS